MSEQAIENKADKPEKKRRKLDATGVLNLLSYPAALASGAAAAWQYVRQESFAVLKRWKKLDEKFGKDNLSYNEYELTETANAGMKKDSGEKLIIARGKIEHKKEELFEHLGLKPFWKRFNIMANNNKWESIGYFVGGATVTLGAYLILANSKDIVGSFFVKGDEKEEKSREKSFVASLTDPRAAVVPPDSITR